MNGTDYILSIFDVNRNAIYPDMQCMPVNTLIRQYCVRHPVKIHAKVIKICALINKVAAFRKNIKFAEYKNYQ